MRQRSTEPVPWHAPKCWHCGAPIETIDMAHAAWDLDEHDRSSNPMVVHKNSSTGCTYFTNPHPNMPVAHFRREPSEAIKIALKRGVRPGQLVEWTKWLRDVLGLFGEKANR